MDRLNKPNFPKIVEVVNQDPKLVLQMVSFSSVAQTDSERRLNLQKKHFYLLNHMKAIYSDQVAKHSTVKSHH